MDKGKHDGTTLGGHTVVYSGRPTHGMSEVAVWIHRKVAGVLVGYEPISDRVIVERLNAKPRNIRTYCDSSVWTNDSSHRERHAVVLLRLVSSS